MRKRILCFLIVALMVFASLPVSVFADNEIDYFYITNLSGEEANVTWSLSSTNPSFEYSTDSTAATWTTASSNTPIVLPANGTLYFRNTNASNTKITMMNSATTSTQVTCNKPHKVGGDITTLLNKNGCVSLPAWNNTFCYLFYQDTNLKDAGELKLPAPAGNNTYQYMFSGCTDLTVAPQLPGLKLSYACYDYMFSGCTSLANAPQLPATELGEYCYRNMFSGCTSLTTGPALPAQTLMKCCYSNMFSGCTALTAAPVLSATVLAEDCYSSMFMGCNSLATAPELPAETMAVGCYASMFSGCTILTAAPELPSTELAKRCYQSMFYNCNSLIEAPELPASTLANACYEGMFSGCSSLSSVRVGFSTFLGENDTNRCTASWLKNVAATGTVYMPEEFVLSSISSIRGEHNIPASWNVLPNESFTVTNGAPNTAAESNNGYLTINKVTAHEGNTITVTINPNEGYKLSDVPFYVLDGVPTSGTSTENANKFTFVMPNRDITINASFEKLMVDDILPADFPTGPVTGWTTSGGSRIYKNDSGLVVVSAGEAEGSLTCFGDDEVSISGGNYVYGDIGSGLMITFYMNSGSLQKINVTWSEYSQYCGDYILPVQSSVTLNANGGSNGTTSITATYGSEMPSAVMPTYTGFVLDGYFDAVSGGVKYYNTDGSSAKRWDKTDSTATLYAQWKPGVTLSFIMNDHGTQIASQIIEAGTTASKPADPSASGWSFDGWYSDEGLTTPFVFTTPITIDTTIYAKWTQNSQPPYPGPYYPTYGSDPTPETAKGKEAAENYTVPVESDKDVIQVSAKIENGIAAVNEITEDVLEGIIRKVSDDETGREGKNDTGNKADTEGNNSITIDLSEAKRDVTGAELSKKSVGNLADALNDNSNNVDSVTIKMKDAFVELDAKALKTLHDTMAGNTLKLVVDKTEEKKLNTNQKNTLSKYDVTKTFEAYFESNGRKIHDFKGGTAKVSVSFTPEKGKKTENYRVYYIDDNGKMQKFATKYENGGLKFVTGHFSDYVIVYDNVKDVLLAEAATTKKGYIKLSWNRLDTAEKYVVYGAKCGKAYKKLAETDKAQLTIKKIGGKKPVADKTYKLYVVAYDALGNKVKSKAIHYIAGNETKKYANINAIEASERTIELKAGEKGEVDVTYTLPVGKTHIPNDHGAAISFTSNCPEVAKVNKNGIITAKKAGTATIYIQDIGGKWCEVEVTVKKK